MIQQIRLRADFAADFDATSFGLGPFFCGCLQVQEQHVGGMLGPNRIPVVENSSNVLLENVSRSGCRSLLILICKHGMSLPNLRDAKYFLGAYNGEVQQISLWPSTCTRAIELQDLHKGHNSST
jgi:hypothetical protein